MRRRKRSWQSCKVEALSQRMQPKRQRSNLPARPTQLQAEGSPARGNGIADRAVGASAQQVVAWRPLPRGIGAQGFNSPNYFPQRGVLGAKCPNARFLVKINGLCLDFLLCAVVVIAQRRLKHYDHRVYTHVVARIGLPVGT